MLAIAFSAKTRSRLWKNQYDIDMLPICCRYAFDMLLVCCWKIVIQRHGRSRANVTCLHHRFVMHEASSKKLSESVGGHNPAPPAGASVLSNLINEPIHQCDGRCALVNSTGTLNTCAAFVAWTNTHVQIQSKAFFFKCCGSVEKFLSSPTTT